MMTICYVNACGRVKSVTNMGAVETMVAMQIEATSAIAIAIAIATTTLNSYASTRVVVLSLAHRR